MKKQSVLMMGILIAAVAAGCGKKSGSPQTGSSPAEEQQAASVPEFAQVWIDPKSAASFGDVDSFIGTAKSGNFPIRSDEFFNPTSQAVVLWVKTSATITSDGAWIGANYTIYHSHGVFALNSLKLTQSQDASTQTKDPNETWNPIVIEANQSVQIEWDMGLSSGFLLCVEGSGFSAIGDGGDGHYNYFQAVGSLVREIRVAPMDISEVEATADASTLNPQHVYVLRNETLPLINAKALGLPDYALPYSDQGLCPYHS